MPAEILVEIFLLVRNDPIVPTASVTRDHGQIYTGNFALLRVTAVCVRWRLVAADFGALWTLGARGHLPRGYIVSSWWVLKQFAPTLPSESMVGTF